MSKRSLLGRSISSEAASQHVPTVAGGGGVTTTTTNGVATTPTRSSRGGPTPENPYSKMNPPLEDQLFVPSRTKNKGNYVCIRLIGSVEAMEAGKPLTSDDAVGAWCTVCKESVWWKKGESNGISRHMSRTHPDILREAGIQRAQTVRSSTSSSSNKRKRDSDVGSSGKTDAADHYNQKCSPINQATFDAMTLVWLTNHFRNYDLVQDEGFQQVISFASTVPGEPQLCSGQAMEQHSVTLQKACDVRLQQLIQSEIVAPHVHYSLSQDKHSFLSNKEEMTVLSVTSIHYVSEAFTPKTLCLHASASALAPAKPDEGLLDFDSWGLDAHKAAFLSNVEGGELSKEDNTSPNTKQVPVIGQSLQLLCGVFYSDKKLAAKAIDDTADFAMDDRSLALMNEEHVKAVRSVVFKIRDIAMNSAGGRGGFDLVSDIASRWNTTHSMLEGALKAQPVIDGWIGSMASAMEEDGSPKPPTMTQKEWALARGIWILMAPFQNLTDSLASETDPVPLAYTIPFLRRVKQILQAKGLFDNNESGAEERTKCGKFVKDNIGQFLEEHKNAKYFESIVKTLEACQATMRKEFDFRFNSVDSTFLWASMLDPRLRKLNHCHDDQEREQAKAALIEEMITLSHEAGSTSSEQEMEQKPPSSSSDDMFGDVFDDPGTNSSVNDGIKKEDPEQKSSSWDQQAAEYELAKYLSEPGVHKSISAFRWWACNYSSYPMLSRCARKLLAALAMVTPKERILSGTGLILSATSPGGFCNEAQWNLRMKLKSLSLSTEEIASSLKEEMETNGNATESIVPTSSFHISV